MSLPINHHWVSNRLLVICLIFGLTACNDNDLQGSNLIGPSISPVVQRHFNRFDHDHDGRVTVDELKRPVLFRRVDRNGDGSITLQEASDYIEQRQAARRRSYAQSRSDTVVAAHIPENYQNTTPVQASYPVHRTWRQTPIAPYPASAIPNALPETARYAPSAPVSARPLRRLARNGDALSADSSMDNGATDAVIASGGIQQFRNLPYATAPGVDPNLLSLDIYAPATGQNHPVIVMVHGGGWQRGDKANANIAANKSRYFTRAGYLFVSINYRLSPAVKHPTHVQDVANALAWIARNISRYHGNPNRIYLMGHSSGAHLAALVATDQRYLQAAGENLRLIKGVILLDGAGYDIPKLMREHHQPDIYVEAFGHDERVWQDASPVAHIAPQKGIAPFLIFYTPRTRSQMLTESLRESLMRAGVPVHIKVVNKSHEQINREVGEFNDNVTKDIINFLK
ncbi:MAG: alpha/beta fold hydrolase [Candidatus Competibacteraceae bacterium]|nr:alpha/beta fold hydrolase [Candidatus Competibacteraceae bacterium]